MALALKAAVRLHRSGRLESSLPRNAIRQAHSRVVLERVRLHSIVAGACSRDRCYNVWDHRLFSFRTRSGGQAILEISYSMAGYPHRDYFCRSSRRSEILSDGFSAAACHNAPRVSAVTEAVGVVGSLHSGIAPVYPRPIGHRDEAPAVRLVRYLEKLYPPSKRGNVLLILPVVYRSAQWYAPQFKILDHVPLAEDEEVLRNAAAVYTDEMSLKGEDYYLIHLADFRRSVLIYPQNRRVRLYLVERRPSA